MIPLAKFYQHSAALAMSLIAIWWLDIVPPFIVACIALGVGLYGLALFLDREKP